MNYISNLKYLQPLLILIPAKSTLDFFFIFLFIFPEETLQLKHLQQELQKP